MTRSDLNTLHLCSILSRASLNRESDYVVAHNARKLALHAKALRRLYEAACNGTLSPRQAKRLATLQANVERLLATYGFTCEHQTDPRGLPVRIPENDFIF